MDKYNRDNLEAEVKVILQWYEAPGIEDSDSGADLPPSKRKRREVSNKPPILAICTPLMARVHKQVCQAAEIVFYDATSSLDRYNTVLSTCILSTTHASGVSLAAVMVSDETEQTVTKAMEMVKQVLPADTFYGNGPMVHQPL